MSYHRVLLVMPNEVERTALVDRLRVDAPHVDVWYLEEAVGFLPAMPQHERRSRSASRAGLLVCDLRSPEQTREITHAVFLMLAVHADLKLLVLLPENRARLIVPSDYASNLASITDIIASNSSPGINSICRSAFDFISSHSS